MAVAGKGNRGITTRQQSPWTPSHDPQNAKFISAAELDVEAISAASMLWVVAEWQ